MSGQAFLEGKKASVCVMGWWGGIQSDEAYSRQSCAFIQTQIQNGFGKSEEVQHLPPASPAPQEDPTTLRETLASWAEAGPNPTIAVL